MMCKCPRCGTLNEKHYKKLNILRDRKKCTECSYFFEIREEVIVVSNQQQQDAVIIKKDKHYDEIKKICEFMAESRRTQFETDEILYGSQINVSKMKLWRILRKMTDKYDILHTIPHRDDRRRKLYMIHNTRNLKRAKCLGKSRYPQQTKLHHIQLKLRIREMNPGLISRLQELNSTYSITEMNNWNQVNIYPQLEHWSSIQINTKSILLHFKGNVLTSNIENAFNYIEQEDLEEIVAFVENLGIIVENHVVDRYYHAAFLRETLPVEDDHWWEDESSGVPEIETDGLNEEEAKQLLALKSTLKRLRRDLLLRRIHSDVLKDLIRHRKQYIKEWGIVRFMRRLHSAELINRTGG